MNHSVFIAHDPREKCLAEVLCARLRQGGVSCWGPDPVWIPPSEAEVRRAILHSQLLIYMRERELKQPSSGFEELKIAAALGRDILLLQKDQIPLDYAALSGPRFRPLGSITIPSGVDERWLSRFVEMVRERLRESALDQQRKDGAATVLVHFAEFVANGTFCCFVNVRNNCSDQRILITKVWFDFESPMPVEPLDRPLPKALSPGEVWETWLPVSRSQPQERFHKAARVQLSSGEVFKSRLNTNVAQEGHPPGGLILHLPKAASDARL